MHLIAITDLGASDIEAIFRLADGIDRAEPHPHQPPSSTKGRHQDNPPLTVAWSFEGRGIRTRTAFLQAFRELGLAYTELPGLLKTSERPKDLAAYLDPFYAAYVIRDADHARLSAFAQASTRPVINAMSSQGHPCEVLTDAYFAARSIGPLTSLRIVLWGPSTNVFRSWQELARVLRLQLEQVCPACWHESLPGVRFLTDPPAKADLVITDAPPADALDEPWALMQAHLQAMGMPRLLPTPPFAIGRELQFDPVDYPDFVGYRQKALLLPVQKAILRHLLGSA
jgi:ornithine carbamoyltransferase